MSLLLPKGTSCHFSGKNLGLAIGSADIYPRRLYSAVKCSSVCWRSCSYGAKSSKSLLPLNPQTKTSAQLCLDILIMKTPNRSGVSMPFDGVQHPSWHPMIKPFQLDKEFSISGPFFVRLRRSVHQRWLSWEHLTPGDETLSFTKVHNKSLQYNKVLIHQKIFHVYF